VSVRPFPAPFIREPSCHIPDLPACRTDKHRTTQIIPQREDLGYGKNDPE